MKKKLLSIWLLCMICLMVPLSTVFAENEPQQVEPNKYEEKKIHLDHKRQDGGVEKQLLPEVQKELTFEKPKKKTNHFIRKALFQSSNQESNSVQVRSKQMNLFEVASPSAKQPEVTNEEQQITKMHLLLVLALILSLVCILVISARHTNHVKRSE